MGRKPLSVNVRTVTAQGPREYQEDTFFTHDMGKGRLLMGVFDGHGGDQVAKKCAELAPKLLPLLLDSYPGDTGVALRMLYLKLDYECKMFEYTGACAAIVLITRERIWFTNCGDSMIAVKIKKYDLYDYMFMSQDHKVSNPLEDFRLRQMGAIITNIDCPRVFGNLNIARSIGDWKLKPYVQSNPYISSLAIEKNTPITICIATDGLWDVMNAKTYFESLAIHKNKIEDVLKQAYAMGSGDNITIVHSDITI